jgi:hypothetical protein
MREGLRLPFCLRAWRSSVGIRFLAVTAIERGRSSSSLLKKCFDTTLHIPKPFKQHGVYRKGCRSVQS